MHVVRNAVDHAIAKSRGSGKPTLIVAKTIIGKGSPNRAGTEKAHGEALGESEIVATRDAMGWPHEPFVVPKDVYASWDARRAGAEREAAWKKLFHAYSARFPQEAGEFNRRLGTALPGKYRSTLDAARASAAEKREAVATRKASQLALEALAPALPEMLGGSADLTGSNLTKWSKAAAMRPNALNGRHTNYGVREFGMCAIANGVRRRSRHPPGEPVLDKRRRSQFTLGRASQAAAGLAFEKVKNSAELDTRLAEAKAAGKTVMLDFYADWCVSCKEMEKFTFSDARVQARLKDTVLLKADVTANTEDDKAMLKRFGLFGPPGLIFWNTQGLQSDFKVIGYEPADKFLASIDKALK